MAGPGDVALMPMAMIIKGIIVKGRSIKAKIILAHLGIACDCFSKGEFVFLIVLIDPDTLQTFAR